VSGGDGAVVTRVLRARRGNEAPRAGIVEDGGVRFLDHDDPFAALRGEGRTVDEVELVDADWIELPARWQIEAPLDAPEVWCAGVTYERSRDARHHDAVEGAKDVYMLVYDAERPELFLKDAAMRRTVGPGAAIGTRSDSRKTIPEPELGVVVGVSGEPIALSIGNDVSSRDIEAENPLYLSQAKIFGGCCAVGPVLAVPADWEQTFDIELRVTRDGTGVFSGRTSTAQLTRSPAELGQWLVRDNPVPPGSVLLTGTGIVVPEEVSLAVGDIVDVEIPGIGRLRNPVADAATLA
jgi:2-dehydro-3-deoxy-D-arabinonate dehydratase